MLVGPLSQTTASVLSYLVNCGTVLAAAAALAVHARSASGRLRRARALVCASLVTVALAGLLAVWVRSPAPGPPTPSVADLVYFLFLPLCVGGLLSYPVAPESEGSWGRVVLDGVVAGAALWFVVWTVLLAPTGIAALPAATLVVALAYPVSDVFVIAAAAGMVTRVADGARGELGLAAAGLSLYAASDIAYTVLNADGAYDPRSWVTVLAQTGLVLLLVGALRAGRTSIGGRWLRTAGALPYLSSGAAVGAAVWAAWVEGGLDGMETVAGCVACTALLVRQVLVHRDRGVALAWARESRVLFRSLVVGSSDLITLHSEDGGLRYASPAVQRLTGLSGSALGEVGLADVVHPDDIDGVRVAHASVLAHPEEPTQVVLRLRAADGSWRWCEALVRNLLHEPTSGAWSATPETSTSRTCCSSGCATTPPTTP
jgi:PAS domain S-box-containing protein